MMRFAVVFFLLFKSLNLSAKELGFWEKLQDQVFEKYEQVSEFIAPRVEFVKFYWGHEFKTKLQPKIIKGYSLYYNYLGSDVADLAYDSYKSLKPKFDKTLLNTHEYYQSQHPITYRYLSDIPAFLKVGYENFIFQIWKNLERLKGHQAIEEHKMALGMADAALRGKESTKYFKQNRHLNDLLDEIKYHSYDYGMQDCYQAYLVELDFNNAFNTGCSVFVSTALYEELQEDPDALRAILAHEIAHGDRGHSLKTLGQLVASGSRHFGQLTMEWLLWIVTGKKHEFYRQVDEQTHLNMILHEFAQKTPAIEIEADVVGSEILIKAGFSKNDLRRALIKLHGATENNIHCKRADVKRSIRSYPGLCNRLEAIESVEDY